MKEYKIRTQAWKWTWFCPLAYTEPDLLGQGQEFPYAELLPEGRLRITANWVAFCCSAISSSFATTAQQGRIEAPQQHGQNWILQPWEEERETEGTAGFLVLRGAVGHGGGGTWPCREGETPVPHVAHPSLLQRLPGTQADEGGTQSSAASLPPVAGPAALGSCWQRS